MTRHSAVTLTGWTDVTVIWARVHTRDSTGASSPPTALLSAHWDDAWTCIGGPHALIKALMHNHPIVDARRVQPDEDALPPELTRLNPGSGEIIWSTLLPSEVATAILELDADDQEHAVRKQSARSHAETDDRPRHPTVSRLRLRRSDRVFGIDQR